MSRLAFIGGGRSRNWLAPVPIAVVGALIVAALTTVFAVSASFAGREAPLVPTSRNTPSGALSSVSPVLAARRRCAMARMREPFSVQTPAESP